MPVHPSIYERSGSFMVHHNPSEVFPLLCPKMEEKWIPGWQCHVIASNSGFAEPNAVFKTEKAFGTELLWFTNVYDQENGLIEYIIFGNDAFVFKFAIAVVAADATSTKLTFSHCLVGLSDKGMGLIEEMKKEDFQARLNGLGRLIDHYLDG